jgi:hypothetical protein
MRQFILERDGHCQVCDRADVMLHVDHIIPKSRGGTDEPTNLRALCASCNQKKGANPPADHEFPALRLTQKTVHPLVGLFCHLSMTEEEKQEFQGWMWAYQGRVLSVGHDVAIVQLFSVLDGEATHVLPVPLKELMAGEWRFYATEETWRQTGEAASTRYFRPRLADRRHA